MIAVIPVFIDRNEKFWVRSEGKKILAKIITTAANSSEIRKLFVFSNDISVAELSKSLDIDCRMIEIDERFEKSELLPIGSYASASYLELNGGFEFEDIMIINFRNPLLPSEILDDAVRKFRTSKKEALVSICSATDHPCQLHANYSIVDVGFIHIFDDIMNSDTYLNRLELNAKIRLEQHDKCMEILRYIKNLNSRESIYHPENLCYKLTKPFYFNWSENRVETKGKCGIYIKYYDHYDLKYKAIEDIEPETEKKVLSDIWIKQGGKSARRLFRTIDDSKFFKNKCNYNDDLKLIGADDSDYYGGKPAFLYKKRDGSILIYLHFQEKDNGPYMIRALPVNQNGPIYDQTMEIEINDYYGPLSLEYDDSETSGLVYSILRLSVDESWEIEEHFQPNDAPWEVIVEEDKKINLVSGKVIMGRQDFPDVYEPDGSIFISKKQSISSFDQEVLKGDSYGFILGRQMSLHIESEFDLLRYNVKKRLAA